tara:strand:- start:852 stop:1040 length:189 start_codon:yes stop_codon:yes gene_type:complete
MLYNRYMEAEMAKTKKKNFISKAEERRARNWLAVRAHFKTGAGSHGDKKKKNSKLACRGRVE